MDAPAPKLIILAGPNGAGKSTLAPFLLRDTLGVVEYVNADTLASGLSAFQPESVAMQAGRIMLRRLHELAAQRANFAFETTLASRSYAAWINRIHRDGYGAHLLFLWLRSPEIAVERVKERVRMGGHNVPEEVVRRRYHRGIQNFFEIYQTLVQTWVVYDNSFPGAPVTIARAVEGTTLDVCEPELWMRFSEASNASQE